MQEYIIDVTVIEDLQNTADKDALQNIMARAKSTIVNGEKVVLVRSKNGSAPERFDALTTLEALADYKMSVFKYL